MLLKKHRHLLKKHKRLLKNTWRCFFDGRIAFLKEMNLINEKTFCELRGCVFLKENIL